MLIGLLLPILTGHAHPAMPTLCVHTKQAKLICEGLVHTQYCDITDQANIQGMITSQHSHFHRIHVMGQGAFYDSTLGQGTIVGTLHANHSTFHHTLHLVGNQAQFDHCELNNITVDSPTPATIKLRHTHVHGTLRFITAPGWVDSEQSHINQCIHCAKKPE